MKTLCVTLGLLLFITCYCDAIREALQNTEPGKCCFKFSNKAVPPKFVLTVTKTHSSCDEQGFIVQTSKRLICFKQTFPWAQKTYKKKIHNHEGSGM